MAATRTMTNLNSEVFTRQCNTSFYKLIKGFGYGKHMFNTRLRKLRNSKSEMAAARHIENLNFEISICVTHHFKGFVR